MLEIKTFTFGLFQTNTYVVSDHAGHAWLIDPACSGRAEQTMLRNYIQAQGLQLTAILATHGHLDHLWGAAWACREWHLPVQMHASDHPLAQAMQQQYDLFGVPMQPEPFPMEEPATETLCEQGIEVLHTPGHTQGSVCFYMSKEKVLFAGDTLFRMGYGRTDLPGGSTAQLIESLERLFTLPADTHVLPGHGDSTTIGAERRY